MPDAPLMPAAHTRSAHGQTCLNALRKTSLGISGIESRMERLRATMPDERTGPVDPVFPVREAGALSGFTQEPYGGEDMKMSIFEIGMLLCFGAALPPSQYQSLRSRSVEGKSLL